MRAAFRLGVVGLLVAASAGAATGLAHADSATPAAAKTNWYWSLAAPSIEGNGLPVGAPTEASAVAAGDLGVGYVVDQAGTQDKVAAVAFDVSSVPLGSTFSSFLVTMPYDRAATQAASGTPDVSACELLDAFEGAPGPSDLATVPPISLPSCVKGTFKDTVGSAGGWVFDLTAIANDWSGGAPAQGILVRPTPNLATPQPPFTISFLGKSAITTTAEYTPPPSPVQPVDQGPVVPPVLPEVAPPPPLTGQVLPPVVPASPPVVPTPQVNPVPTTQPLAGVAYHPGALVPSGAWWLASLGLLGMLGLTALVLGDPLAPVVVDARRRRFAEVVRAQGRPTSPAPTRAARPARRFRPA